MKLVVMRHGQTNYNKEHRLQGRKNIPLSDKGLSQAAATRDEMIAAGLHFDRVLSSPLERAVQTAEIVGGVNREQIAREERIIEIDFGPLEGQQVESLDDNMRNFFNDPAEYIPPEGAESYAELLTRMGSFLSAMREDKSDDTILAVSHGAALHALYMLVTGITLEHYWDKAIGNCGWFVISNETGEWEIISESMHAEAWPLPSASFLSGE